MGSTLPTSPGTFRLGGSYLVIGGIPMRSLDRWLIPYVLQTGRRLRRSLGPIHVLICIADHFEPKIVQRHSGSRSLTRREMGARVSRGTLAIAVTATGGRHVIRSSTRSRTTSTSSRRRTGGALPGRLRRSRVPPTSRQDTAGEPPGDVAGGRRLLPVPSWPARPRPEDRSSRFRFHPRELGDSIIPGLAAAGAA